LLNIRINKDSRISLREQIGAQLEFLIATGKLKPGAPLPGARVLARMLGIHHHTVGKAYQDVEERNLLVGKRGSRMLVRHPEERTTRSRPELDDVIDQAIRTARDYNYSLQELSARVRERLTEEPADHVLVLSFDAGMRRLLKAEIEDTVKCRVKACSPEELIANPDLALGALVASPPGVLPAITKILPKGRLATPIHYSSAESHLAAAVNLKRPSLIAIVSVSEHFLEMSRGLLGALVGDKHTLIECMVSGEERVQIPTADLLYCDAIVLGRLPNARSRKNVIVYRLISAECLDQITAMMSLTQRQS